MPMPGKPGRGQATLRAPQQHMDLYRARARAAGMALGDYLAMVLARSHDLEVPDYIIVRNPQQLEIPLGA